MFDLNEFRGRKVARLGVVATCRVVCRVYVWCVCVRVCACVCVRVCVCVCCGFAGACVYVRVNMSVCNVRAHHMNIFDVAYDVRTRQRKPTKRTAMVG
jgi:hypothetical protein